MTQYLRLLNSEDMTSHLKAAMDEARRIHQAWIRAAWEPTFQAQRPTLLDRGTSEALRAYLDRQR